MLAADADLELGPHRAAAVDAEGNELAHALLVHRLERVDRQNFLGQVIRQEASDVVAREPERHLGQVVRPEGEELGRLRHLAGGEGGARNLDHGAVHEGDFLEPELAAGLRVHLVHERLLVLELVGGAGDGDHDLGEGLAALLEDLAGGLEDGAHLHFGDFRVGDAEAHAAVAEHRVVFAQAFRALGELRLVHAELGAQGGELLRIVRDELVQGRIEEADGDRKSLHHLEGGLEVVLDEYGQLVERPAAFLDGLRHDHLAEQEQRLVAALAVEHVLGAEQADALGPERERLGGVLGRVGVGSDAEHLLLFDELHEIAIGLVVIEVDVHQIEGVLVHEALRPVQRDPFAFPYRHAALGVERFSVGADLEVAAADDAALAPAARHQGRVRGHASLGGENGLRLVHAVHVFGRRLLAHEDDFLAPGRPVDRVLRGEDGAPHGAARTGGQPLGDGPRGQFGLGVDHGEQELDELVRADAHHRRVGVDELFRVHFRRHAHGGHAVPFPDAALEHEELSFFDGEFDVLHVLVVLLQAPLNRIELPVAGGHGGLEGGEIAALVVLGICVDGRRGADAGHDVFALGVHQVLAVELVLAAARVAGKGDAGGGVVAHVAEHHGLDGDRRAPFIGDFFDAAVLDRALSAPAHEHGADAAPELIEGILGEGLSEHVLHDLFELHDQVGQFLGGELGVELVALLLFDFFHALVEDFAHALAALGLDAFGFFHDDVGVHHDQAPVRVVGKAGVAGLGDDALDRLVVQSHVQNRVHHARHGLSRPGPHGHEQGVFPVTEFFPHQFLHPGEGGGHVRLQFPRVGPLVLVIVRTDLGRDGEAGRHRQSEVGMTRHFRQVGAFAAQQVFHGFVPVGFAAAE